MASAQGPQWWETRGVLTNATAINDYAPANIGQLKHVSRQAYYEMQATYFGGSGTDVSNMVNSLAPGGDYNPLNIGQLKNVAQPFYSRLIGIGYTNRFPWEGAIAANDYAPANIGQLKNAFSFDVTNWPDLLLIVPLDITLSCEEARDTSVTGEAEAYDTRTNSPPTSDQLLWINEFHYDNAGTDTDEFIEVAGVEGTDLSGYSLVLYNGNGGGTYNTKNLSGIIDNEEFGFGAIAFTYPVDGIQNGAPDGMALCSSTGVVEFLSYEGTFTASGGPADGMSSVNVGVSENSSTAVGTSLQLTGDLNAFTWGGSSADSPGDLNVGQHMIPPGPPALTLSYSDNITTGACDNSLEISRTWLAEDGNGGSTSKVQIITVEDVQAPQLTAPPDIFVRDITLIHPNQTGWASVSDNCDAFIPAPELPVWINEIHYDNDGTDTGEAIEIAGVAGTDVSNYSLILYNGVDGEEYQALSLSGILADEGCGYGVQTYAISGIQNGAPDGIALCTSESVEQFLSYEGTFTATEGPAIGMTSVDIGQYEPSSTAVGHSLQLYGSGNQYAEFTWAGHGANSFGTLNTDQTISPCGFGLTLSYTNSPAAEFSSNIYVVTRVWMATDSCGNSTNAIQLITEDPLDSDGDGLPDWWESQYFGGPTNAVALADSDGDGLTNLEEYLISTSPVDNDSDNDGLPDGWEVLYGLDPLDDGSIDIDNGPEGNPDGDEFDNLLEYELGAPADNPAWNGEELAYMLTHIHTDEFSPSARSASAPSGGLRVDIDPPECDQAGYHNVTDPLSVPDLLKCGYYIDIAVEGLVEDVDDGYDEVYFEAFTNTYYFSSHDGIPDGDTEYCKMVNEQNICNNLIMANSTVLLRYDTVGDRWTRDDAYAEITAATYTGDYQVEISGDSKVCIGDTITLTATGGAGAPYTWSGGGHASVNSSGEVTGNSPGITTITAADANGCSAEYEVNVIQVSVSGNSTVCVGDNVMFTASGGDAPYSWSSSGNASVNSSGVVTGTSPGTATITATDANGCSDQQQISVEKVEIIGDSSVCMGETITLTASGGNTPYSWGSSDISIATVNSSGELTGVAPGTAMITVTDYHGCSSQKQIVVLKVDIVSIDPDAEILCKGCDLTINAEVSPAGRSLEWTIQSDSTGGASLSSSSGSSTVLTVLETANNGAVVVRVAAVAAPSCYDEVQITVWGPQGYPPRRPANASFFAGRTEAEIAWAMRHPICARRLRNMNIDRLVFAEVHRVFPNANCASDPNVGNAFQHAFLMCRVAQICDANTAAELGDAHEEYAENDCRAGHAIMDFHNNDVGVQASIGCSDCSDCILDAIRNGATRWMDPPPSMPPTPSCNYEFTGHTNGMSGNPCIPTP